MIRVGNIYRSSTSLGGNPSLPLNSVQFNNASAFGGSANFLFIDPSVLIGGVLTPPASGGNYYAFGDSITVGTGGAGVTYPNLIATALGLTPHNMGVVASTLEKQTPLFAVGGTMIDQIPNIPIKGVNDKLLSFCFGINDINGGYPNYNPTNFLADYTTVLNAAIANGWLGSQILLFSTTYQNPVNYGSVGPGGGTITLAIQNQFNSDVATLAATFGCVLVDVFTYLANRGGIVNLSDSIHPNAVGYNLMAQCALTAINTPVFNTGQSLAVNGNTELENLILHDPGVIADNNVVLLGLDNSNNRVGETIILPNNTRSLATLLIGGNIIQTNSTIPATTIGPNDIIARRGASIFGSFDGVNTFWTQIELCDSTVSVNINLNYSQGQFRVKNASGVIGFQVFQLGNIAIGSAESNDSTARAGDVYVPVLSGIKCFSSGTAPTERLAQFIPFNTNAVSSIINTHLSGGFNILLTAGLGDGPEVDIFHVFNSGSLILQNGGTYTENTNCRFQVNDTAKGIMRPRMTTTQKNAIPVSAADEGLMVYDLTLHQPFYYNGTIWVVG